MKLWAYLKTGGGEMLCVVVFLLMVVGTVLNLIGTYRNHKTMKEATQCLSTWLLTSPLYVKKEGK